MLKHKRLMIFISLAFILAPLTIKKFSLISDDTAAALTLTCSDTNNCTQMQFSTDNANWTVPETFTTTKAWTLTSEREKGIGYF